jgi:chromate transport protein ChrA
MNALIHEIKKIGSLSLFFLIGFGYILLVMKLFMEEYSINVYVLSKAIIGALFAAKAVLIVNATPLFNRFRQSPLYISVLYKTCLYTLAVLILGILEGVIDAYRKTKTISLAISTFIQTRNLDRVLAVILCVGVVFFIYNILKEIDAYLGKGNLQKLFLNSPKKTLNSR